MKKGQVGTVFKLLISAAFAVALLGIIYSYTQSISPPITAVEASEDVLESASNAPGQCFSRNPAHFQEGQPYIPSVLETHTGGKKVNIKNSLGKLYDSSKREIVRDVDSSLSAECNSECYLWLGSSECG